MGKKEFFGGDYCFDTVAFLRRPVRECPEDAILAARDLGLPGGLLKGRDYMILDVPCLLNGHIIMQFAVEAREGGIS